MAEQEVYTKEKLREIESLKSYAFNERANYESIWKQVAIYCGLNRYFYDERKNDRKDDIEVNNSQAIIALNQTSDSMLGILIGNGDFFKIKIKNSVYDLLKNNNITYSVGQLNDYIEHINNVIQEQLFNKESNFIKTLHKSIKEYFAFGNTGMPGNITFSTNAYAVKDSFKPTLNSVAKVIKKYSKTFVEITGHTDSTGNAATNNTLSFNRANAVGNYLKTQGVSANRMLIEGKGSRDPIASNSTATGREKNRRVEITLINNQ